MSVMLLVCSLGAFGLVKYQGHHIKS